MQRLEIIRPDDWHVHLRDGGALTAVVPDTARRFARAIVMPNLRPPIVTTAAALAYRERILRAVPAGIGFTPLMTLYLTDNTAPAEIGRARASGAVFGVKCYPAGATTNSDFGVTAIERAWPVLEALAESGMPLLVHGEVTDRDVDVFDREARFIDAVLAPICARFPKLRIVFEHVTTAVAVEFVRAAPANVAATITPQHLRLNRNALFEGGIRPHHYCLPVLKRERDRRALVDAAVSGNPKFFLGSDSAPHATHTKLAACGCAGIYSAHAGIELYAEAFEDAGALDALEAFASRHGPAFYGLPVNAERIVLERASWRIPDELPFGESTVVPFNAGAECRWRLA